MTSGATSAPESSCATSSRTCRPGYPGQVRQRREAGQAPRVRPAGRPARAPAEAEGGPFRPGPSHRGGRKDLRIRHVDRPPVLHLPPRHRRARASVSATG